MEISNFNRFSKGAAVQKENFEKGLTVRDVLMKYNLFVSEEI